MTISISSGVKPADYQVIDHLALEGVGADYVTIDIAHGHAESVRRMIEHIKTKLPSSFVIAGNVGTPEAVIDLANWGAFNEVYRRLVPDPKPVRTAVGAALLPGFLVEVEMWAAR